MKGLTIKIDQTELVKNTQKIKIDINKKSLEQQVYWLIIRDLSRLNWEIRPSENSKFLTIIPPKSYDRNTIRETMAVKRDEILLKNKRWIDRHLEIARRNLATGYEALNSEIDPVIEICESEKQHDLFRMYRYYWSSPHSEYVGRRIKLLIRDNALPTKPIIGIAALGSSIVHIPERDLYIGWDVETRTKNLIYTMDAYVIGALPPYNLLLGGKLISYLLASTEVRHIYESKYNKVITRISNRESNQLFGIFTTSLYGRSSQYNRLKYKNKLLYIPIGETKGYGTLHLSEETIEKMQEYLKVNKIFITNKFGDGPSWTMRTINKVGKMLGFDSDVLLKHSFKREIYFIPLVRNWKNILAQDFEEPNYFNYSKDELVDFWKERWLLKRKNNPKIINSLKNFYPQDFMI